MKAWGCNDQEYRVCSHDSRGCFEYEYCVANSKEEAIHCMKGQRKNRGLPARNGYTAVPLNQIKCKEAGE